MKNLMVNRTGITLILFTLAAACLASIGYIRPQLPMEWSAIEVGLSREEVLAQIPDAFVDMRDLKGISIATRKFQQFGFRRCWWELTVTYDQAGLVDSVDMYFTDPNCGLFNMKWEPPD